MKRPVLISIICFLFMFFMIQGGWAQDLQVVSRNVKGNEHVVSEHILSTVGTKIGETLNREQLQKDVEAIYELGFFSFVDVELTPEAGGVAVTYVVKENPVIEKIEISGNTIYSDEDLMKLVFTTPGTVFNRVFFRHDLERIQEKYQKDGYVMMRIADVQVENGIINVQIMEPIVGDIIIQGNTKTKRYVIERQIKVKKGDLFNATVLRHSINKLQQLGYFEDVNVGFEPGDTPLATNIVVTVEEKKTASVGLSISHGTESGWSGGLSYGDINWKGRGHKAEIGFETGDNEQYWLTYIEPYMDETHYSWKVGAYKRVWEERGYYRSGDKRLEYDEERVGFYFGAGKKFTHDPRLSWFLTLDWHDVDVYNIKKTSLGTQEDIDDLTKGTTFAAIGTLTRSTLDEYLSYPKGDVIDLNVEHALDFLGADWTYTKYWLQGRYYVPLLGLNDFLDMNLGKEDNPPILAARIKAGFSSGTLPSAERFSIGGSNSLRGYDGGEFEGDEMFLANVEARLPIENAFGFVLFYDAGNAWRDDKNFSLSDLHDSWGVGVRVKTPIGNLRLDYAKGDEENKTHFGFGELF
ncbi:MAG: BamA/TamA family outer membrane protein [Aminobacterium sp.]|nr:BamA/TamA family outer membrane protein [Aminobacterium sp.]